MGHVASEKTYDSAVTEALAVLDEPLPLTSHDRCDRCVAQAQRRFILHTGDLLFCGHHAAQYADALAKLVAIPRSM